VTISRQGAWPPAHALLLRRLERRRRRRSPVVGSRVAVPPSRRDVLRVTAAAIASAPIGCAPRDRGTRERGRVVVTFWYAFGDLNRKILLERVAAFNACQSRIEVKPVHQGDYFEALAKLRTAIAADRAPTLSHVVLEVLPYLARAGVLEPLDRYDGAGSIPFIPALTQAGSFAVDPRDSVFGIPFNRSTPIVFANRHALDRGAVALPSNWEELVDVARRLMRRAANGETRWGFEVPISWWYWVAMVGQAGGRLVDDSGRVMLGGDAGERAIRFWQRLVHEEHVMRPPAGRDYQAWQSTNENFLRGGVAMIWSSTAFVRYLEDNAPFPVVAGPLPRGPVRPSVPTGGTMFVILRAAPEEEKRAAWEFLRWMCDADQVIAWSTRTGYMPVTRAAVERLNAQGFYERHPNDRVAYEQLADVDPWPWEPELFRIERDAVEPRLEAAVFAGRDAHEVMQEAREDARRPG